MSDEEGLGSMAELEFYPANQVERWRSFKERNKITRLKF